MGRWQISALGPPSRRHSHQEREFHVLLSFGHLFGPKPLRDFAVVGFQKKMTGRALSKIVAAILLFLLTGCIHTVFAGNAVSPPQGLPPLIMVGLARAQSIVVSSHGAFSVTGPGGKIPVPANDVVSFAAEPQGLNVQAGDSGNFGGFSASRGPVSVSVEDPQSGAFLIVKERRGADSNIEGNGYLGRLIIMLDEDGLIAANVVDIESYVKSVVSWEMSDGWPVESLKAQAVVARTYAAYKTGIRRIPGFGLPDYGDLGRLTPDSVALWATDQIYRGVLANKPNCVKAADLTVGQIATYGGAPIAAYFHSSAEGMTEDPRFVWGGSFPYLKPVEEMPYISPYSAWLAEFDGETLRERLLGLGVQGEVLSVSGCEPGPSGRWCGILVETSFGTVRLKGTDFRNTLGTQVLRSLLFSSYWQGEGLSASACLNPSIPAFATDGSKTVAVKLGQAQVMGAGGVVAPQLHQGLFAVSGAKYPGPPGLAFSGKGWGHGVGLSQWGARAMGLAGSIFGDILAAYYPGISLETWW